MNSEDKKQTEVLNDLEDIKELLDDDPFAHLPELEEMIPVLEETIPVLHEEVEILPNIQVSLDAENSTETVEQQLSRTHHEQQPAPPQLITEVTSETTNNLAVDTETLDNTIDFQRIDFTMHVPAVPPGHAPDKLQDYVELNIENKFELVDENETTDVTEEASGETEELVVTEDVPEEIEELAIPEDVPEKIEELAVSEDKPEKTEELAVSEDEPEKTEELAASEDVSGVINETATTEDLFDKAEVITTTEETSEQESDEVVILDSAWEKVEILLMENLPPQISGAFLELLNSRLTENKQQLLDELSLLDEDAFLEIMEALDDNQGF